MSKEYYVYRYNTVTAEFVEESDYVYDDAYDDFERESYIESFVRSNFDFMIICIHVKSENAYSKIGNLTGVVKFVLSENLDEQDAIVMGNFNADITYFDEGNISNPFKSSDFYGLISNGMDNMTKTDYSYNRIVLLETTYDHEYVEDSASVFTFDSEYDIMNQTRVCKVSEHYPIFAKFKTNLIDDD